MEATGQKHTSLDVLVDAVGFAVKNEVTDAIVIMVVGNDIKVFQSVGKVDPFVGILGATIAEALNYKE